MAKEAKSALEIAKIIRKHLGESNLRIGVFADPDYGWQAIVYSDTGDIDELQTKVDGIARQLRPEFQLDVEAQR